MENIEKSKVELDGKVYFVDKSLRIGEAFKEILEKDDNNYVACVYNNRVKSFGHKLKFDGKIKFLDASSNDGREIFVSGLMMIMTKAFYDVNPNIEVHINYQLHNSMYCSLKDEIVTDELLKKVKERMLQIIKEDKLIEHKPMSLEEGREFFEKKGYKRGGFQLYNKEKEKVDLYYIDDFYNYFYGIMPDRTGRMKKFDIFKYDEGFLVMYPDRKDLTKVPKFENKIKLHKTMKAYDDIYEILGVQTVYELNEKIKKNPKDIVLLSEALHEKNMSDLADKIGEKENVKMILIAGPSCSGKTTFARKITNRLRLKGFRPVIISVDNYFVEREDTPKDKDGNYDFEALNAIDLDLFNRDLQKLIDGEEIEMPEFNFKEGKKEYNGKKLKLNKDQILVIEGIHCLNDELTKKIDPKYKFKIYISALTVLNMDTQNRIGTSDTRLLRRIVRDYRTRNYSAEQTLKNWDSVRRGERQNIFPYQETADFMFNTAVIYEQAILKKDLLKLLDQIDENSEVYSTAKRLKGFINYFDELDKAYIPNDSIIREFIGGSIYYDTYLDEIREEHLSSIENENIGEENRFRKTLIDKFKKLKKINKEKE